MDVYILRHGKAGEAGPGTSDTDRMLTEKGRKEIASAGRWIVSQGIRFDLIAASPLTRAQETAAIIANALGHKAGPVTWKVLAPGGNPDMVCHVVGRHKDTRAILLVGHEPLLSTLISRIISGKDTAAIGLSKGSLAKIREFTCSTDPSGELHWLLTAKQMAGLR
jgi:phosphohistidine phosphatase